METSSSNKKVAIYLILFAVALALIYSMSNYFPNENNAVLNPNFQSYSSEELGISFEYPIKYETRKIEGNNLIILGLPNNAKKENVRIKAERDDARTSSDRPVAFEDYFYLDGKYNEKTKVGRREYLVFISETGYGDGGHTTDPYVAFVTKEKNNFYIITFWGDTELSEDESKILESFRIDKVVNLSVFKG